jgi:RNA polymerase sigma factor (sigma-70 family)
MTPILSSAILRTQSDARLLALASRGYERAFEAIVERYRKPLHRWCRTVLPEARAEDAVQTAFLKAWSALQAGIEVTDLRPWLYRIARNSALDNARKAGYDYDELSDALKLAPAPESELERRQVIRETLTGVAGLPDNQRAALLRTAAGHSRAEIARDLQVTEGSVRQLVHRARTTLRAAATAVTPMPLVSWAAALGAEAGGPAGQRIAELAAGAGSAGLAATAVKAGTVLVAAGVLAAGPGSDLRRAVGKDDPAVAADQPPGRAGEGGRRRLGRRERARAGWGRLPRRAGRGRGEHGVPPARALRRPRPELRGPPRVRAPRGRARLPRTRRLRGHRRGPLAERQPQPLRLRSQRLRLHSLALVARAGELRPRPLLRLRLRLLGVRALRTRARPAAGGRTAARGAPGPRARPAAGQLRQGQELRLDAHHHGPARLTAVRPALWTFSGRP